MSDETQKLEDQQTQQIATQPMDNNHGEAKQNGHTDENSNAPSNMSNLCLKLISNSHKTNMIFPLNIGLTTLGRSKTSHVSLIHKSVSRNHSSIQIDLNEDSLEVHKCFIIDHGSLNKTKLNNQELIKEEKNELNLDDQIEIGSLKFKLEKMTDEQVKEQELSRTNTIDLYETSSPSKTKPGLLEIQNTMEETVLIEDEKAFNEETEPEDNAGEENNLDNTSCPDFRLHMSSSFINQSVVSNKSLAIPETMAVEEEEDENKPEPAVETEQKSQTDEPEPVTQTIAVVDDLTEFKTVQVEAEENTKEEIKNEISKETTNFESDKKSSETTETKCDFEVKKYNSLNDESIIINDDDDEDDINLEKLKTQKNIIVSEVEKPNDEVIVESTLMNTSVAEKSQPTSQLSETDPSHASPIKEAPVRRGRGRPRSSIGTKQEKNAPEAKTEPRRSARASLAPEKFQQEDTENMAETIEEKPEVKVGRRSSLRVRNTPNPVVKPKKSVKPVDEKEEEENDDEKKEDSSKEKNRRKTIDVSQIEQQQPKRKVGRPRLNKDEDKSSPKRKSDENENLKSKKTRRGRKPREESTDEDDEDNETLENVKKMLRKRSADKAETETTPKIFFNSKRRQTPNSSFNQTPKPNENPDTPSKKFKLHKAISSSDENLNKSSADETDQKPQEENEEKEAKSDDTESKSIEVANVEKIDEKNEREDQQDDSKNSKKVSRTGSSRLPVASTRHSTRSNRN